MVLWRFMGLRFRNQGSEFRVLGLGFKLRAFAPSFFWQALIPLLDKPEPLNPVSWALIQEFN